jgi:hypothetical protein
MNTLLQVLVRRAKLDANKPVSKNSRRESIAK